MSWNYPLELLQQMHQLAPSIIVKDGEEVVGYALVTLKEAGNFHNDLRTMFTNLQAVNYQNAPLMSYSFYVMGQVCIEKNYRGKGIFSLLFQHHKTIYSQRYQFLVTEISSSNIRSIKAHEKVGFKTIYTYRDNNDEWNVVLWDWRNNPADQLA